MQIDLNRYNRQLEGFHKWKDAGCRGTLEYVTGMGKTFTAIQSAKHFITREPEFRVIVGVPTDILRTDWRKNVTTHGIAQNFYVDTIHNLVKMDLDADMLILDEIHMYVGEEAEVFPLVFEAITAEKIMGLTATLGHDGIDRELVDHYCPVVDTIGLQEALENGWVSDYIEYNLPVELSGEDRAEYDRLDAKFRKQFKLFYNDLGVQPFDMIKKCLKIDRVTGNFIDPMARRFANSIAHDPTRLVINATNAMRAIRERKSFLYSAPSKIHVAKQIIEMFPDKKYITFAQTTASADAMADAVSDAKPYHSNLRTLVLHNGNPIGHKADAKGLYYIFDNARLGIAEGLYTWKQIQDMTDRQCSRMGKETQKSYILDLFRSNQIRGICTAMAFDQGVDEQDLELAIILSGKAKDRQNTQRIGRVIRKKEGKRAIIVQLVLKDTQEEKWLESRQVNTNNVKDIVSISQIQL